MTPAARVQAAIEILDAIVDGAPVEKALTGWARRSRFAGSKDRAAIRDHVFDALRCKRSFAALGGAETGRGLMLGWVRAGNGDPAKLFTGDRHAPMPITADETGHAPASEAERLDIPDWLWPEFAHSLADEADPAARALQSRAPVHLRVNTLRSTPDAAIANLAQDAIEARRHPACSTALEIVSGARAVARSRAYLDGLVELQDAASQAVVEALNLTAGMRVLDFCAGGGGKTLALAAHHGVTVFAHDAAPNRMRDLPARAERAGANVTVLDHSQIARCAPFDIVLTDVPCSGSGSWRRAPAGKWALSPNWLADIARTQGAILRQAAELVGAGGVLAYATCSMLRVENDDVIDAYLAEAPAWCDTLRQSWLVSHGTDGFYTAHLTRKVV